MKLTDFIYNIVNSHNTSLGNNAAFPSREDVAYDYHVIKCRFEEVIENINSEFGYLPSTDDALSLLSEYVTLAQKKEEPLKDQLETLVTNIVNEALATPRETVILRTSLVNKIEPLNDIRVMPEDDNDGNKEYSFEDVEEIDLSNKVIMKRRFINSLVQGVSYSLMLQYLDDDRIYEWDDELVDIYYKIIYLNDYLLFTKKEKISEKNPQLGAYVDVDLGEGEFKTEIDAQGVIFPFLLQETFRGFFELFGSYGLPDDKTKANYIIHRADFLLAEAWDLRLGVKMWKDIETCYPVSQTSYLPYIFTAIVALKGDEFNDMVKNLLCHTKKGQGFVQNIVDDLQYDQDYQQFKQDIELANLEKCLINDEEKLDNDTISESKMRAWGEQYLEQLRQTAQDIYNKRDDIWAGNVVKHKIQLETGEDIGVWASSREVFEEVFPNQTDAVAFQRDGWICLSIEKDYSPKEIYDIIEHEFEHALDSRLSGSENIFNQAQVDINSLASSEPGETIANDVEKSDLFDTIRNVIYRLWINSEKNAFTQEVINDKSYLKRLAWQIDYIDKKDADKNADVWYHFQPLLANRKNYTTKMSPRDIKRHFIRQSRHKLEQYKKTIFRKKGYAKINNSDEPSDEYYVSTSNGEVVGPYTFRELLDNQNRLSFGTTDPKVFQKGTRKWEYLDKVLMQDPEYARNMKEIELAFNESKEARPLVEGITDVTYHYCSYHTLWNVLNDGQIKLTLSSNHADAYHKRKLFYLSTQRSKNNKLGYAGNGKREVRIELDGYALKASGYEGMPVDYWGGSMGKQSDIGLNASRLDLNNPESLSDDDRRTITKSQGKSSNFEFEDRIFSSKPYIPTKFINRVDCLVSTLNPIQKEILVKAQEVGVQVYFYNNEKDFILQTNNTINDQISQIEGEPEKGLQYSGQLQDERNAMLCTELCCLLLYYNYHNHYKTDSEVTYNELNEVLDKFGLGEYYEFASKNLDYRMHNFGYLIDNISNSIRKLNTDSITRTDKSNNIMELCQYVLNHYGCRSLIELKIYFGKHPWQRERPKEGQVVEYVKAVKFNYGGEDGYRLIKADDKRFWDYVSKDDFYYSLERLVSDDGWNRENGYDTKVSHKSKNDESFLKYIQHLTHNDNLSLYDGAAVLNKILGKDDIEYQFGIMVVPCLVNKEEYVQEENANHVRYSDQEDFRLALFGSDNNYYAYLYPNSEN